MERFNWEQTSSTKEAGMVFSDLYHMECETFLGLKGDKR
jgi:hypothetical protein